MLTDEDLMPFGKYKGTKMEDVPASYLLWLDREGTNNIPVALYIKENMDVLLKEI